MKILHYLIFASLVMVMSCANSSQKASEIKVANSVKQFKATKNDNEFVLDEEKFRSWADQLAVKAYYSGISNKTLDTYIKNLEFEPKTIRLDRRQPYKTRTLAQYLQNIVPQSRVNKAVAKYYENENILLKVSKYYQVEPSVILALWAIESNFGANMGSFNIPNSLTSLAFEGRREKFFTKELLNALKIIDDGHISYENMKGSWAGAMGQTQFMPSSFLELAVDFDGDMKKDIWGTKADIFGSIANYLNKRGWKKDNIWGVEVSFAKNAKKINDKLISSKVKKPLSFWKKTGLIIPKLPAYIDNNTKVSVVRPEKNGDKLFMVFSNYQTILNWNRSLYFATAVGTLSDNIKKVIEK